jgi:hypothetical protein
VCAHADEIGMVHTSELERIRATRDVNGQKPCDAPCAQARLEKEHRLRIATGNYGCLECGADTFTWSQYRAWLRTADDTANAAQTTAASHHE